MTDNCLFFGKLLCFCSFCFRFPRKFIFWKLNNSATCRSTQYVKIREDYETLSKIPVSKLHQMTSRCRGENRNRTTTSNNFLLKINVTIMCVFFDYSYDNNTRLLVSSAKSISLELPSITRSSCRENRGARSSCLPAYSLIKNLVTSLSIAQEKLKNVLFAGLFENFFINQPHTFW